ncbi:MAG: 30S ribosomal protein S16 [Vampirovibrionales bacterium]|nr:30S ribosomal protein S16 [Vampirovibrionales bacterium]
MVTIRLKRFGRKKKPFYRVVAMHAAEKRQGAPLQELGYYDPIAKLLKLDLEATQTWVSKGANTSETVSRLIKLADGRSGEVIQLPKREPKPKAAPAPVQEEAPAAD